MRMVVESFQWKSWPAILWMPRMPAPVQATAPTKALRQAVQTRTNEAMLAAVAEAVVLGGGEQAQAAPEGAEQDPADE